MLELAAIVVGLTSAVALALGSVALGWPLSGLRRAAVSMVEAIGLSALFLVANLAVMVGVVFVARAFHDFLSIYVTAKITWLGVSVLQGLTFHAWWRSRRRSGPDTSSPDRIRQS